MRQGWSFALMGKEQKELHQGPRDGQFVPCTKRSDKSRPIIVFSLCAKAQTTGQENETSVENDTGLSEFGSIRWPPALGGLF